MDVVSRDEWLAARTALLAKEKAFDKQRDALAAERQSLPAVKITKPYSFEGADGTVSLGGLFGDKSQLLVYHFMFGPDWDEGCPSCTFWIDSFDNDGAHLAARDISLVAVAKAPYATLAAYRERFGWKTPFYSAANTDFNEDFQVTFTPEQQEAGATYNYKPGSWKNGSEGPGASAFLKTPDGDILHTYSTFARGLDMLNGAYHLMDIAPKGRDEGNMPYTQAWVRRRDQYGT